MTVADDANLQINETEVGPMQTNEKTYTIFTKKMAIELRKLGYKIIRTEPNRDKPELDVYVFSVYGNFVQDLNRLLEENKSK